MMAEKKYRVAIVPGSFDPITNGHVDVVRRAAEMSEKVFVAVMINDQKKYLFSLDERTEIAVAACDGLSGVEVRSSSGMLWELARDLSADAIIKGVRNETDREYELAMAKYNAEHYPSALTVLLEASEGLSDVSSTLVRGAIERAENLGKYMPAAAAELAEKIIKNR